MTEVTEPGTSRAPAKRAVFELPDGGEIGGSSITERDYLRNIALKRRSSKTTRVREITVESVFIVEVGSDIDEALTLMTDRRIRHLPVVSEGNLAGMVSIGDLVKHKTMGQAFQIKYLEEYISAR